MAGDLPRSLGAEIGLRGVDVELVGGAGVGFETLGIGQGLLDVGLDGFVAAHVEGLRETPVAHGAVGIDADGLLEGFRGFVVPEIVKEAEALIEPGLRFGCGLDGDVAVADAGHLDGDGELVGRRDGLHVGHGRHLGGCAGGEGEKQESGTER